MLIDSAGTTRWHESQPPTPEAQVAARERGYFINELRSRPVEASDFDRFDWIIGMTREHQQFLRERRRSHDQAQILLITAFSTNPGFREIADPFSQGQEAYDLADGLLQYVPKDRLTPWEAMCHPFFDALHDPSATLPNGKPLPSLLFYGSSDELAAMKREQGLLGQARLRDHRHLRRGQPRLRRGTVPRAAPSPRGEEGRQSRSERRAFAIPHSLRKEK